MRPRARRAALVPGLVLALSACGSDAAPPGRSLAAAEPSAAFDLPSVGSAYPCAEPLPADPAAARAEIRDSYRTWKRRYLTERGAGGGLRVTLGPSYDDETISEGMGYGMLLAAYMDDRGALDGMWHYASAKRNERGLMSWKVDREGRVVDVNAATDGDQDIAFALVVADARWGGYRAPATELIAAILRHEVEAGTAVLKPGDVWGGSAVTNPSYFAPGYYRVFAAYSGEDAWVRVADRAYDVLAASASSAGLQPTWTTAAGDSAAGFARGFEYGAARVPLRLAQDAAWHCEARAASLLSGFNGFYARVGPERLVDGYRLDGTPTGEGRTAVFVGPAAAAALASADPSHRAAAWRAAVELRDPGYYSESLRLLSLLLASGAMPAPRVQPAPGGA